MLQRLLELQSVFELLQRRLLAHIDDFLIRQQLAECFAQRVLDDVARVEGGGRLGGQQHRSGQRVAGKVLPAVVGGGRVAFLNLIKMKRKSKHRQQEKQDGSVGR